MKMREIKFRGYSDKDSEWRYGFYVADNVTHEIYTLMPAGALYASVVDVESLGQCTGIEDKNGFKIYEGDILRNNHPRVNIAGEVLCRHGVWVSYKNDGNSFCIYEFSEQCEIIGNIYQNPELLESK
jgi:uncharacterized phage protein (TIGR01671 family)